MGGNCRVIATATPSFQRVRDLRGILYLSQTVGETSDEHYDRYIATSKKVTIDRAKGEDPNLQLDPEDADDALQLDDLDYDMPTNKDFDEVNELLKDTPLWELSEENQERACKVIHWVAFD
jgi:hypothetical protein